MPPQHCVSNANSPLCPPPLHQSPILPRSKTRPARNAGIPYHSRRSSSCPKKTFSRVLPAGESRGAGRSPEGPQPLRLRQAAGYASPCLRCCGARAHSPAAGPVPPGLWGGAGTLPETARAQLARLQGGQRHRYLVCPSLTP